MGLAVLPSRLKNELAKVEEFILEGKDLSSDETVSKHAEWVDSFKDNYEFTAENIDAIVKKEVGKVFVKCLEHAGVYKRDEKGMAAFERFIRYVANK